MNPLNTGNNIYYEELYHPFYRNVLYTAPIEMTKETDDRLILKDTNLVELKNNLTELETRSTNKSIRNYDYLNFGEHGLDNLKPELLWHNSFKTEKHEKSENVFKFMLTYESEELPLNPTILTEEKNIINWLQAGATASPSSNTSDNILYTDSDGINHTFWFYGEVNVDGIVCNAKWMDGNSETSYKLEPNVVYTYRRPEQTVLDTIDETINHPDQDEIIFAQGQTEGKKVLDKTRYHHDGEIIYH